MLPLVINWQPPKDIVDSDIQSDAIEFSYVPYLFFGLAMLY